MGRVLCGWRNSDVEYDEKWLPLPPYIRVLMRGGAFAPRPSAVDNGGRRPLCQADDLAYRFEHRVLQKAGMRCAALFLRRKVQEVDMASRRTANKCN